MTALYKCYDLTRSNDVIEKEPPMPIWQGTRIRPRNEYHVFHRDLSISILYIHLRHPSRHQNNNLRHHLLYRIRAVILSVIQRECHAFRTSLPHQYHSCVL